MVSVTLQIEFYGVCDEASPSAGIISDVLCYIAADVNDIMQI